MKIYFMSDYGKQTSVDVESNTESEIYRAIAKELVTFEPTCSVRVSNEEIGSAAYGIAAGEAILRLTVRGEKEDEFDALVQDILAKAGELAGRGGVVQLRSHGVRPAQGRAGAQAERHSRGGKCRARRRRS